VLLHIFDTKAEQNCLFRPLVYMPIAIGLLFRNTQLAAVECVERIFNRVALFACGRG
jgi:hypothetical protein